MTILSFPPGRYWIPALAGMAVLTGCGQESASPGQLISCRPAGAPAFARDCTVDRSAGPDGAILTLHHADGRFRRLLVLKDGRGVVAADGAEPATIRMNGDREIEVMVGGDRYRLPAKPKGAAAAS